MLNVSQWGTLSTRTTRVCTGAVAGIADRAGIAKTRTYGPAPSSTHTSRSSGVQAMPWPPAAPASGNGAEAITRPVVTSATWNPAYPLTSFTSSVPTPLIEKGASTPVQQYPLTVRTVRFVVVSAKIG